MRILFLTDNFSPEVNAPATRTHEHCKEWVKSGADVTVITCFPNFPEGRVYDGYKNVWKKVEWIDGIRVIRVWSYVAANEGFIKRILDYVSFSVSSFIAGLSVRSDIIIATSPQFFTALAGRSLSFWKRKPWIMEVRDLWPESIKTVGVMKDNLFIRYFEWEEKICYKSANKIIVVTDSFKNEIIKKGIEPSKIEVVKNGANLDRYVPCAKDKALLSDLGLEDKFIFGYIGTHGMAHKLDFILDCAKALGKKEPEIHFLLIGNGAEKEKLSKKVVDEKIHNVTMMNAVPKNQVARFLGILDAGIINLKKSDLFKTVIPSKIFETAAMEVPILIGVDGEARQIIESYHAGLFYEPENESDFMHKSLQLVHNDELVIQLKKGCKELAMDYDRKGLAEKMLNTIRETVGEM